jgi:hypothetical protein
MTFSYDLTGGFTDLTRVRFDLGDTDEEAAIFSDEEINAVVLDVGSWQQAVIKCLKHIIAKLSAQPDMTADWLKVSATAALASYRRLLADKEAEYGGGVEDGDTGINTDPVYVYRIDSDATEPPYGSA